jgi:hypothetical protein
LSSPYLRNRPFQRAPARERIGPYLAQASLTSHSRGKEKRERRGESKEKGEGRQERRGEIGE